MTEGHDADPYRARPIAMPPAARPAFPTAFEETSIADAVYLYWTGKITRPRIVSTVGCLGAAAIAPLVGLIVSLALGAHDALPGLAVLAVVFALLFGWMLHAATRVYRAGRALNRDDVGTAERILSGANLAWSGAGPFLGLCRLRRGDHAGAVETYSKSLGGHALSASTLDPNHWPLPSLLAIAYCNVGRLDLAALRLRSANPTVGYCRALVLVGWHYAKLASNQPPDPAELAGLEQTFTPVTGSWGGLALAGLGYRRLGDTARGAHLIEQERGRRGFEHLEKMLPLLWRELQGTPAVSAVGTPG